MMWKFFIRPLLFLLDPEAAHYFTLNSLKFICKIPGVKNLISRIYSVQNKQKPIELFGLQFKNPVGLAAGLDKDGKYIIELALFGFSHIEIGTVTPLAQPGNPLPRLFRLPKDKALINRMGFNNEGAASMAARLNKLNKPKGLILGINIGKNKDTPIEKAWEDYLKCFEILHPYADYFTINISSPNTPGLRGLQDKEPLILLLSKINDANRSKSRPKPVLVKIAPDLDTEQLSEIKQICLDQKMDGIIIGNTTLDRKNLITDSQQLNIMGPGGLSGQPLLLNSDEKLSSLMTMPGNIPFIGVGGIMDANSAKYKLEIGASLVQVYTSFIYSGPAIVQDICG
ncbi:MAG: quinone-dependent dihydroorotate dehydrogenase [Saprospiraceae bacterium]